VLKRLTTLACAGALSVVCGSATARPAGPYAATADPVIAAAGDIACDPNASSFKNGKGTSSECRQKYTAALLAGVNAVLPLGDLQYESGPLNNFTNSYALSWGAYKAITHPAPGNHDYQTSGAAGYYAYFGAAAGDPAKGYYSYDLGGWHLIALNSSCSPVGGCGTASAQTVWLRNDLSRTTKSCILAYWHHPRFSSATHGSDTSYDAFWQALYAAHADVVLVGHDHTYERFALQNPAGQADPAGIREFVAGTGGKSHYTFRTVIPNSEVRNANTFGVLKLTLHPNSYDWQFVPESGSFTDSGSTACHPGGPTAVSLASFSAVRTRAGAVLLRWRMASETRTLGFNIYRQGKGKVVKLNRTLIPSVSGGTATGHAYSRLDRNVPRAGWKLRYRLQAVDLDGTRSWMGSAATTR
jgi:calcineurin-like phosphoesterase family protein